MLFGTGVMTHVLLVAAPPKIQPLGFPTLAVRDVLG
jgi:hypothetical protein